MMKVKKCVKASKSTTPELIDIQKGCTNLLDLLDSVDATLFDLAECDQLHEELDYVARRCKMLLEGDLEG